MPFIYATQTHAPASEVRPAAGLLKSLRHLWCRHRSTITTAKTDHMPAHVVCQSCGWREPLMASVPQGTRTWDSSRDEARYQMEKRRRTTLEEQRQLAVARFASPEEPRSRTRRSRHTLLHMTPAVGE